MKTTQDFIDAYNKGQHEYDIVCFTGEYTGFMLRYQGRKANNDFLFTPKYKVFETIFGEGEVTKCCGEDYDPDRACFSCGNPSDWVTKAQGHAQSAVITPNAFNYILENM